VYSGVLNPVAGFFQLFKSVLHNNHKISNNNNNRNYKEEVNTNLKLQ